MPEEIESKYKAADFAVIRRRLKQVGAKFLGKSQQTDCFFDSADRRMFKGNMALRVRTTKIIRHGAGGDDSQSMLTFKGPPGRNAKAKVRMEIQTAIGDTDSVSEILSQLGYRPRLIIQKRRESYRIGKSVVELDELPIIGKFVEIESPSIADIARIANKLELSGPAITTSYLRMLTMACPRLSKKCISATFADCLSCRD